jgi:hypothetical protein
MEEGGKEGMRTEAGAAVVVVVRDNSDVLPVLS